MKEAKVCEKNKEAYIKLKRLVRFLFPALVAVYVSSIPAYALEGKQRQVVARAGFSSQMKYEDFMLYDVMVVFSLPGLKKQTSVITVTGRLNATAGMFAAAGKDALLASLGPAVALKRTGGRVTLAGGFNFACVSRYEFGDADLGGPVQFLSYLGLEIGITQRLGISYHFQHLSNAGIYNHNPGLNLHSFGLSYHF